MHNHAVRLELCTSVRGCQRCACDRCLNLNADKTPIRRDIEYRSIEQLHFRRRLIFETKMNELNKKAKPGCIFYIPAISKRGEAGFLLARYIELLKPNVGYFIEVFDIFYLEPPTSFGQIDMSRRLFRPVMFDMYFQYVPRWKVLFQDAAYDRAQSNYSQIAIAFHTELWVGGKSLPLPPGAAKKFEGATCWSPYQIIFLVNAHLAGIFGPEERYDYHRVP